MILPEIMHRIGIDSDNVVAPETEAAREIKCRPSFAVPSFGNAYCDNKRRRKRAKHQNGLIKNQQPYQAKTQLTGFLKQKRASKTHKRGKNSVNNLITKYRINQSVN